ncbi:MAG: FKBP-type peptidyl-prolyl cis-trans isomerase [Rikenellaceae bacterium]
MKKVVVTALVLGAAVICSCSSQQQAKQSGIVKGDASKLDTLSYALGSNIASSIKYQMPDLPLSFSDMAEGVETAALTSNGMSHEEAITILQTYFMETRPVRAELVDEKRNAADSVALANGTSAEDVAAARAALVADADMFESEAQRSEVSFAFGIDLGTNLSNEDLPLQVYWINKGMSDVNNNESVMSEEAVMEYLQNYFTVVRPAELMKQSLEKLAEVEKLPGVVKTESGLMYRIDKEGDNSVVATNDSDVVKVNYTGRLLRNNEVFDSSRFEDTSAEMLEMLKMRDPEGYNQDRPIEFPLNGVIAGWTEGMKLVGKGGRISLWIPAELAYGAQGAGSAIGPNEALYFDIELLDVNPTAE